MHRAAVHGSPFRWAASTCSAGFGPGAPSFWDWGHCHVALVLHCPSSATVHGGLRAVAACPVAVKYGAVMLLARQTSHCAAHGERAARRPEAPSP